MSQLKQNDDISFEQTRKQTHTHTTDKSVKAEMSSLICFLLAKDVLIMALTHSHTDTKRLTHTHS